MAKVYGFNTSEDISRIGRVVKRVEGRAPPGDSFRPNGNRGDFGRVLVCKTTEAKTAGNMITCEIWDGSSQAAFAASGVTLPAYLRLGDASSGKWCYVVETVRGYEVLNVQC